MKVKQQSDDFQVEERTHVVPSEEGAFALYRLEKRGWSTPEAMAVVSRRWRIEPRRLSYGGLKDRHAVTAQYLTIWHGPQRNLTHERLRVTYLGQTARPYSSADIRANHFHLILRDLTLEACTAAQRAVEEVRVEGIPNYFDDQRFGSVMPGGEFIARLLVQERFEDALRLALTGPYEYDRAAQKQEKATLLRYWGDWAACKERLPRGPVATLAGYLQVHPDDYRGAMARLRPELRGLYLSVYQSYLWNRILARWLREHCRPNQLVTTSLRLGEVPMFHTLDEAQREEMASLMVPLPSARLHMGESDSWAPFVHGVLAEEGLELHQMKVKGIRELFFSKGERPAVCLPVNVEHEAAPDERRPGRRRLALTFDLPRGCYATLVVKRITAAKPPAA